MNTTSRKTGKQPVLSRVPCSARPGKVIAAAKGKGSYRRAREKRIPWENA